MADGHRLDLPLTVHLEATAATSDSVDYALASVHADASVLLQDLTARDLIGQAEQRARRRGGERGGARAEADLYRQTLDGLVVNATSRKGLPASRTKAGR